MKKLAVRFKHAKQVQEFREVFESCREASRAAEEVGTGGGVGDGEIRE